MTVVDWKHGKLADGLRLYRARKYFEAHEQWETVWIRSHEPEKTFLQAVIQVAGACHHYQRGNRPGTKSLLKAALRRLNSTDDAAFEGMHLGKLREALSCWLAALETSCAVGAEPPTQVRHLRALDD
jgi:hypothetical protein